MGGSGGGSGGGGSSGSIDYPTYMKDRHAVLYDKIRDAADKAITDNPYVGLHGWSPENMIKQMEATVDYYDNVIHKFEPLDVWKSLMGVVPNVIFDMLDTQPLDNFIEVQKKSLRRGVEDEILPVYRRGMQDAGAVMTSAFKIGEALLWSKELDEEVKLGKEFHGKLSLAAYDYAFKSANDVINLTLQKISYHKEVIHYNLEVLRMGYAAMKEWQDSENIYAIEKVKWSLEMQKYVMDALGCISSSAGTSYSTSSAGGSRVSSAIGGALAGAASGAAISGGNPVGAAIGGAIGLVAGLF